MKSLLKVFIWGMFFLSLQSCGDKCKELLCENGGQCYDGECNCSKWYSGESCQLLYNRNYEGEYVGKANSNGRSMAETWEIVADKATPNRMYMPNGAYYEFVSDSTLVIPKQILDEKGGRAIISGEGKYSLNEIELLYRLEYPNEILIENKFMGERKGFSPEQ